MVGGEPDGVGNCEMAAVAWWWSVVGWWQGWHYCFTVTLLYYCVMVILCNYDGNYDLVSITVHCCLHYFALLFALLCLSMPPKAAWAGPALSFCSLTSCTVNSNRLHKR